MLSAKILNHCALRLKLTQYCKLTVLQLKILVFNISKNAKKLNFDI